MQKQPLVKKTPKKEDIIGSETVIDLIYLMYTASHYWQYKETELMMNEYKRISKSRDEKIELDIDDLSIYKDK